MSQSLHMLLFVAALQFKHFVADGPLQTAHMVQRKSIYGSGLGVLHALIHALGTLVICTAFSIRLELGLELALLDGVFHYHIDFIKESIVKAAGWTIKDGPFWWALSADQMLHQFTYLLLAALALGVQL